MELRKDPITQSWVILGQREARGDVLEECPLEAGQAREAEVHSDVACGRGPGRCVWYRTPTLFITWKGSQGRVAEGMYDKMVALGAHEVVVETPVHDKKDVAAQRRRD